ncbi:hypothetical protein Q1695_005937 [Nippostrongylus brasiliensis]|nr:hypothetical protein Q1695_005937 [Nippostrongylus brasiliensis]
MTPDEMKKELDLKKEAQSRNKDSDSKEWVVYKDVDILTKLYKTFVLPHVEYATVHVFTRLLLRRTFQYREKEDHTRSCFLPSDSTWRS